MFEPKTTPKDVFLHLLMLVMLYIGVISLLALVFAYIDYGYPDPLTYYPGDTLDVIRFSSSMLIVSFPLLLLFSWFIQRDLRKNPKKHDLRFGKWLTYLTLFVSAITIVIDLIQLVHRFYSGDLSTPFTLKVLSVLVITGAVFGYFVWDVQSEPHNSKIPNLVAWAASAVVLGMLVSGFFIAGSPSKQRQVRMDEQRVSDLQMIQGEIINQWQNKRVLPQTTDNLKNDISGFIPPRDPETGAPYEYVILAPLKFKLCANFKFPSPYLADQSRMPVPAGVYYKTSNYGGGNEVWSHEAGPKCYERTIDPALYPKPIQ